MIIIMNLQSARGKFLQCFLSRDYSRRGISLLQILVHAPMSQRQFPAGFLDLRNGCGPAEDLQTVAEFIELLVRLIIF